MSYFLSSIELYPNVINYHLTDRDTLVNYDPSAEPSIVTDTYTSSGGETSGPAYDLVDDRLDNQISIDTTSLGAMSVDFDLTTNVTVDTVIVANHNLTTAGDGTFRVQYGSTTTATMNSASSGSRAVTGEFQCSSDSVATNYALVASNGTTIVNLDSFTSNNVELDFVPQVTWLADTDIGEVCVCQKWTSPFAPETNGWQDSEFYGDGFLRSPGGQGFGSVTHGERKRITLAWKYLTQANYDALKKVLRITRGKTHPLFVDLGEHATNAYLRFMRIVNFGPGTTQSGVHWNVILTLEEE